MDVECCEIVITDADAERLVALTRGSLVDAVVARAVELHDYDVPCVLAVPLVGGNPAYLRWIAQETREP